MADEATESTVQGGEPGPAGDPTPPANQDGGPGENAAARNEGEGGDPNPDAKGADSEGAKKDPDARWQKRVDTLTARAKGAEEENARLREELEGFKSERDRRELEDLKGLPVMAEALTEAERRDVKDLRPKLQRLREDADYWFEHAEDGTELQNGQRLSGAQCLELGRRADRDASRLEARLDAIMDSGRGRLSRLLKRHGDELLGGDGQTAGGKAPEPPRPPAPPKPPTPQKAPERAPGGGAPASGKEGAGKPPPMRLSQEQLQAAWAG